jgi:hypothetical protein
MLRYIELMKEAALRTYENQVLVWSSLAPHQKRKKDPPPIPAILMR